MATTLRVKIGERWYTVQVENAEASPIRVLVDGEQVEVDIEVEPAVTDGAANPPSQAPAAAPTPTPTPSQPDPPVDAPAAGANSFTSPMPGVIVSVTVREGQQVATGDEVCILEAMKMQQVLRADRTGVVQTVHVSPGQQVLDGDPILDLA